MYIIYRGVDQWSDGRVHNPKVVGSNPTSAIQVMSISRVLEPILPRGLLDRKRPSAIRQYLVEIPKA